MSLPLLQLKPRPQKQLPAPITTRTTHTPSTCPRTSLRHLPTTRRKIRRPSRPLAPASCTSSLFPSPPWGAGSGVGVMGVRILPPDLIIKHLPGTGIDGRVGSLDWELRLQRPTLSPSPAHFPRCISGALLGSAGCPPSSCLALVASTHRGTLWPPPLPQSSSLVLVATLSSLQSTQGPCQPCSHSVLRSVPAMEATSVGLSVHIPPASSPSHTCLSCPWSFFCHQCVTLGTLT